MWLNFLNHLHKRPSIYILWWYIYFTSIIWLFWSCGDVRRKCFCPARLGTADLRHASCVFCDRSTAVVTCCQEDLQLLKHLESVEFNQFTHIVSCFYIHCKQFFVTWVLEGQWDLWSILSGSMQVRLAELIPKALLAQIQKKGCHGVTLSNTPNEYILNSILLEEGLASFVQQWMEKNLST